MKNIILLIALIFTLNIKAQDADKTVQITVSGSGKTQDEAKQNALRSAIEQAFGTFISTKTEILNDNLVKDEIVSVANGNIQKYDIVSEVQTPDGNYATTLNAIVSVTKLTSFAESKGVIVEFKGSLFGANLKQQKINEEAEWKAIINLCEVSNNILSNGLDYSVEVGEPQKSTLIQRPNDFEILLTVKSTPNSNYDKFKDYFIANIKALSLTKSEQDDYIKLNKKIFCLYTKNHGEYYFRSSNSLIALQNLFLKSNRYIHDFIVKIDNDTISINTTKGNLYNVYYNGHEDKREIWALNMDSISRYNSGGMARGSQNHNFGFPDFKFPGVNINYIYYDWRAAERGMVNSWEVYFDKLGTLNTEFLLGRDNYYSWVSEQKYNESEYYTIPGIRSCKIAEREIGVIGIINLSKKNYISRYIAVFTEEEISKIANISVKKIN